MNKIQFDKSNLYILFTAVLLAAFIFFGYLEFEVWGQVEYYRSGYVNAGGFFVSPHMLRYMVVHPVYEISAALGFDLNAVYTWYLFISAIVVSKVWASVRRSYTQSKRSFSFLIAIPLILLFFVNGRFVFGLLGLSFFLKCVVDLEFERFNFFHFSLIFFGILFSSVSSGVFFVGVVFLLVSLFDLYRRRPGFIAFPMKVVLLVPVVLVSFFSLIFLQKNFTYFVEQSGSAIGILKHGFGFLIVPDAFHDLCGSGRGSLQCSVLSIFNGEARFLLAFIILGLLILFLLAFKKFSIVPEVAFRGLCISVLGGVFGFTTLFSFIFVIPIFFLNKRK
ncbi:MAG: hypothetical protein V7693_17785 [Halopseudomonas sabulinigri]